MSAVLSVLRAPHPVVRTLAVVAGVVALVVAAAVSPRVPLPLAAAAVAAVLAMAAAARWPGAAATCALVVIAVVPMYWGQPLIGKAIVALPATVAAIVLAPAAVSAARAFRPNLADLLYLGFVGFLALASLLNVRSGTGASVGLLWRYLVPYLVWRTFGLRWLRWPVVTGALVGAGTLLGGLAIQERASGHNPFFDLGPMGYQADQWAHSTYRFGGVRAEASFGEPISFSLFLAVCIVLAVTVVVASRNRTAQVAAAVGTVVMTYALLDTGSRAGVVAVALGLGMQLLRLVPRVRLRRLLLVSVAITAFLVATPVGASALHSLQSISGSSTTTSESRSADYRLAVLSVLTDSSRYTLLGRPSDQAQGVTELGVRESGLKSLDNEYAFLLVVGGALALVPFVLLGGLVTVDALAGRGGTVYVRAVTSALAAVFLLLLTVSLLVQLADLFVLLLALLAAQRQRDREAVPT